MNDADQPKPSRNSLESFNKSPYLSIKHSTYFHVYDKLFAQYADKEITFVEVGIFNGGSLFMWRDFFGPKARIIGIDLNPVAEKWRDHGFEIFIGSQQSPKFWKELFEQIGPIDILLDDGGHTFEQQVVTSECALPHIKDGGLMVIEDTHTSYMPEFGGPSPASFVSYAKNITDGINHRFSGFVGSKPSEKVISSVQFFESIVAFEVDRRLATMPSSPVGNSGESMQAKDFRYKNQNNISVASYLKAFKY